MRRALLKIFRFLQRRNRRFSLHLVRVTNYSRRTGSFNRVIRSSNQLQAARNGAGIRSTYHNGRQSSPMPTRPPFAIQNRDSVAVFGEKKKYLWLKPTFSLFFIIYVSPKIISTNSILTVATFITCSNCLTPRKPIICCSLERPRFGLKCGPAVTSSQRRE